MHGRSYQATAIAGLVALLIGAAACNDSNDVTGPPSGGGASNLVVSNATPSNGNATITGTATLTINAASTGFDELYLTETVGGISHEIVVTWDTSTHAINSTQCGWFDGVSTGGSTQCLDGVNTCDPAKISLDFAGHKVTFSGLVLDDMVGTTSHATLTGTLAW